MGKELYTGLAIEGETLAWAALQRVREGLQSVAQGREPLPPAATGGEPAPREVRLLAGLKSLAPRLKGRLTLGMASEQVLLRVLRLPSVDDAELKGMVAFQAEKLAPFPVDTIVVGHEVLQRGTDASIVLVAAVRIDVVEAVGVALQQAGVVAARVDAAVLGWWRVLQDGGHVAAEGCAVEVLLTATAPLLIVSRQGIPLVFRALPEEANGAVAVDELVRELGFTLMALELEQGHLDAPRITIWSEEEPRTEWMQALRAEHGDEVRRAALAELAPLGEGLARRGAEAGTLDLTPESWRHTRASAGFRRRLIQTSGAIVGAWLLVVSVAVGMLALEAYKLARVQGERDTLRKPALAVRETRRRVFMVQQYMDSTNSALECLRAASALLPPAGIELTAFAFNKGEELKLSGEAQSVALVYEFKTRIDESGLFPVASLQGPRTAQSGREIFDVILQLAVAGDDES